MLHATELIQDHFGAKMRVQQAHRSLVSQCQIGKVQPGEEPLFIPENINTTSHYLGNLQDRLGHGPVEALITGIPLNGAPADGKKLSDLALRNFQVLSQAKESGLAQAFFAELDEIKARVDARLLSSFPAQNGQDI